MNGRSEHAVGETFIEALRPLVAEIVAAEVDLRLADLRERDSSGDFLTVAEYARRHRASPGAVYARVRRGTLQAVRPPGSREWLIPVSDGEAGRNRHCLDT